MAAPVVLQRLGAGLNSSLCVAAEEEDDGERGSGKSWLCSFSPCEWRRQEENEGRELGIERWDRSG